VGAASSGFLLDSKAGFSPRDCRCHSASLLAARTVTPIRVRRGNESRGAVPYPNGGRPEIVVPSLPDAAIDTRRVFSPDGARMFVSSVGEQRHDRRRPGGRTSRADVLSFTPEARIAASMPPACAIARAKRSSHAPVHYGAR